MNPLWYILIAYLLMCGLTAWFLDSTPFKYNGWLLNFIFAPAYWYAAFRGGL